MEINKAIEILKEEISKIQCDKANKYKPEYFKSTYEQRIESLTFAISTLESLQQAREELEKRKGLNKKPDADWGFGICLSCNRLMYGDELYNHNENHTIKFYAGYNQGYNASYDLAEKIIARLKLRIYELYHHEAENFTLRKEIEELKNTSETAKELLREIKERCSVEKIEEIIKANEKR